MFLFLFTLNLVNVYKHYKMNFPSPYPVPTVGVSIWYLISPIRFPRLANTVVNSAVKQQTFEHQHWPRHLIRPGSSRLCLATMPVFPKGLYGQEKPFSDDKRRQPSFVVKTEFFGLKEMAGDAWPSCL